MATKKKISCFFCTEEMFNSASSTIQVLECGHLSHKECFGKAFEAAKGQRQKCPFDKRAVNHPFPVDLRIDFDEDDDVPGW